MLYLDANATEPLRPEARQASVAALGLGNPSSTHAAGRAARRVLEDARETVARFFGAAAKDVIFCSGATEANALAVHALGAGRPKLCGATEHDAIRAATPDAIIVPVDARGQADLAALDALLAAQAIPALVCLMAANNETGILHDIEAAGRICAAHGALLHVDAVQAVGRDNRDWFGLGAASIAVSGHKFGAPMGAGALIVSAGRAVAPLLPGGGQEQGRRGGTPSLPAIAGLAAALGAPYDSAKIVAYRDEIEAFCVRLGAMVPGAGAPRLPNTTCLALPGVRADTQLIALDMAGIAVSAGSACSSGKVAASHVLEAMGAGALAGQAIRVSLPWDVAADAVPAFCAAYEKMRMRCVEKA
ncbi:MAG TPA: aminotransferase class V-fold PLP-dependent enzyme [Acidocella sp.]|jgi:cysteine desulfurase|uniref:cysteine desulfurase family protein n=1 Tax=Acidocella sp. TaxID=50710 RepID=UPI002C7E1E71|nr:aminotransferase class V-fold PLP-dependent enzyme [Acidocella sp.]HVE23677.1 aminotransferase class V-fold PLP-dependent enzyme [Acidocella sp.]